MDGIRQKVLSFSTHWPSVKPQNGSGFVWHLAPYSSYMWESIVLQWCRLYRNVNVILMESAEGIRSPTLIKGELLRCLKLIGIFMAMTQISRSHHITNLIDGNHARKLTGKHSLESCI